MHSRFWLLVGVLVTGVHGRLLAQDVAGNLEGWVLDTAGSPVASAQVTVQGNGLPAGRSTTATSRGYFRIGQLPVGSYDVEVRAIGYRPVTLQHVGVRLGATTLAGTAILEPAPMELAGITVWAERPLIDPTSAAGGATLSAEHFEDLPIERSYRTLPALLPSVNLEREGINVNGAGGFDNLWFVDGASVTNSMDGSGSTIIPWNFVKEVEVRSGGYEAEYRGALGGVVDVVTKSGGDRFEAQTFAYFQNNSLTGNPRVIAGETPGGGFARWDVGGSVGGPLVRGRLWFYAAYAPAVERQQVDIPSFGEYTDRLTRHSFAGKLTWQPHRNSTLVASIIGDPTTRNAVGDFWGWVLDPVSALANPDPWLTRQRTGGVAASLHATHVAGATLLDALASYSRQKGEVQAATALGASVPTFVDSQYVWSGGIPVHGYLHNTTASVRASATRTVGSHTLKVGGEVLRLGLDQQQLADIYGQRADASFTGMHWSQPGSVHNTMHALFLQDSWLVSPRLRVNAGVRLDGERNVGSDGRASLTMSNEWQPRVGFVFQPGRLGTQRITGAYGRFYEGLFTSLASLYFAYGSSWGGFTYPNDPRVDTTGAVRDWGGDVVRVSDPHLKGQSFDEWSLGYERALTRRLKAGVRAVYRHHLWGIEDSYDAALDNFVFGNPGRGQLSEYPRMRREYHALQFSLDGQLSERLWVLASYVLSRSYGNWPGLYDADYGYINVNFTGEFDNLGQLRNSTGRLPNDRPHVIKLNASYRLASNLVTGASLLVQSGMPLSEFGRDTSSYHNLFLVQRGTAGRMPMTWDLGTRIAWSPPIGVAGGRPSVLLDVYHVASPRHAVSLDQGHYRSADDQENQLDPNPNYLKPTAFQPAMAARLGVVLDF